MIHRWVAHAAYDIVRVCTVLPKLLWRPLQPRPQVSKDGSVVLLAPVCRRTLLRRHGNKGSGNRAESRRAGQCVDLLGVFFLKYLHRLDVAALNLLARAARLDSGPWRIVAQPKLFTASEKKARSTV